MGSISEIIATGGLHACEFAQSLLTDVTPEMFARVAPGAGRVTQANHAAFIFGHLSLYPQRVLRLAGLDPMSAAVPFEYNQLFAPGAACLDDPFGDEYPVMDEITSTFFRVTYIAIESFAVMTDDALSQPYTVGGPTDLPLSVGAAANFMLNGHVMLHLGQISTWRRNMGLGPADLPV